MIGCFIFFACIGAPINFKTLAEHALIRLSQSQWMQGGGVSYLVCVIGCVC